MSTLPLNSTISHYRILSKIGAGGMGEVYLAQDLHLERKVALKVLHAEIAEDEERVRRFVQEAKAASALNHPNILTVYEIGHLEKSRYIATELIKGENLRDRLRAEPLTLSETLDIALQVAAALNAAHEAGIVHRDIKPENIMLRDDGLAKVLDFGLAKLTEKKSETISLEDTTRVQTLPGLVMGTVVYMSPEQARGKKVDARSDIWSLGVLIYEMCARRTPFAGETTSDIIAAILTKDPTPLDVETPPELQRIIRKSLQKRADERYQTAKDFQLDLKNLKRELEFSEQLERSQIPGFTKPRNVKTSELDEAVTVAQPADVSTVKSLSGQPSAIQTQAGKSKVQRLGVASGLIVLLATIGVGFWFVTNRSSGIRQIESIAVMPFVNESGNADVEYLSDGMTDTLIGSLSQLPNLNVKARSLVYRYKNKDIDPRTIGKDLSVQALLNGRVVPRGDDLRLYLELVDAQTGDRIWGDQYNRKQSDLVSLQSEIALDVSQKLQSRLSGSDEQKLTKKYTENAEAYQLYLRGRYFLNRRTSESLQKAIGYFNQAIAVDPNYALGYAGLADTYLLLGLPDAITGALSPQDSLPKARTAAEKALQIDNSVAEVYYSLGQVRSKELDWSGAESAFEQGKRLGPNYPIGHLYYSIYLASLGKQEQALKEIRRAQELDPLSLPINCSVVYVLYFGRQYDEAIAVGKKTLEMDQTFALAHQRLGMAYVGKKMHPEAIAEFKQAANNSNDAPLAIVSLGHAYAMSGNKKEALRVLAELKDMSQRRYVSAYSVSTIYAGLGEKEQAFQWLQKADDERNTEIVFMKVDPRLDPLRDDPRFQELVKKVGIPQ
ncbi:MAG TPA: protein kinase [Blastocatellia bacterium]|nr:protein kinase [Blastocatellia bacterium]